MRLLLAGLVGIRYVDEEPGTDGIDRGGAERPPQVRLAVLGPAEKIEGELGLCNGVVGL